jgi:hypothetical protein
MEIGMKIASVFFYQAVQIKGKMINSANEAHYDIEYKDGVCLIYDRAQKILVAVPNTNIPQMIVAEVPAEKPLSNIEKALAAKKAKREAELASQHSE